MELELDVVLVFRVTLVVIEVLETLEVLEAVGRVTVPFRVALAWATTFGAGIFWLSSGTLILIGSVVVTLPEIGLPCPASADFDASPSWVLFSRMSVVASCPGTTFRLSTEVTMAFLAVPIASLLDGEGFETDDEARGLKVGSASFIGGGTGILSGEG